MASSRNRTDEDDETLASADTEDEDEDAPLQIALVELTKRAKNIPGRPGGSKLFHEENPAHPLDPGTKRHEVLVVADRVVKVAMTPAVRQAIADGRIRDVTGRKEATPRPISVVEVIDGKNGAPPPTVQPLPADAAPAAVANGSTVATVSGASSGASSKAAKGS